MAVVVLCSMIAASYPFPFPYNWSRFPAAWFGANATSFESDAAMDEIGRYSLAILRLAGANHRNQLDGIDP